MPISARRTEFRGGFTLMEVLMALVVLAVLSTMLSQTLQGSLRIHQLQREEPEILERKRLRVARQLSGELEEPVLTLTEQEEEE